MNCRNCGLPKQGAYHQVDEIPVLGSGKLDKLLT